MKRVSPFDARGYYYYYGGSGGAAPVRAGALGAFSVLSLSPFAWYDPSDLTTLFQDAAMTTPVTADSDPVGAMLDKSGNGHHITQSTAGLRPLYKTSGGLHWLESDGDDFLASATFGTALAQPCAAVSAFRNLDALIGTNGHLASSTGFNFSLYIIAGDDAVDPLEIRMYSGVELEVHVQATVGTDFVATQEVDGASSRIAVDNGSYVTGDSGTNAAVDFILFAAGGGAQPTQARFYGRTQFDRLLTDQEVANLRTYLAAKQGRSL